MLYDHEARPDDKHEPGDRCKDCGEPVIWLGPTQYDWVHGVSDHPTYPEENIMDQSTKTTRELVDDVVEKAKAVVMKHKKKLLVAATVVVLVSKNRGLKKENLKLEEKNEGLQAQLNETSRFATRAAAQLDEAVPLLDRYLGKSKF